MRERLIELMIDAKRTDPEDGKFSEWLADYLLGHGVTVPPVKVGDTVYQVVSGRIYEAKITQLIYNTDGIAFDAEAIGKAVFMTRAEAEARLR